MLHSYALRGVYDVVHTSTTRRTAGGRLQPAQHCTQMVQSVVSATFLSFMSTALCGHVRVPVAGSEETILMLLDEGSQINLVWHETARRFATGPGRPWTLHLQVVGNSFRHIPTLLYDIVLVDSQGRRQPHRKHRHSFNNTGPHWGQEDIS